jgi:Protein of unknown function (DUF2877)
MVQMPAGLTVPRSPSSPVGTSNRGHRGHRVPQRAHRAGTVAGMTGAANPRTLIVTGAASLAIRQPLTGPRRPVRVIAASPAAVYLELPATAPEPRVLVLAAAGTSRPPNAIAVTPANLDRFAPGALASAMTGAADGEAWTGHGAVQAGDLTVHVLRWWDPSPVLGPLSRARLEQGAAALHRACASPGRGPALAGHDDPATLAACCSGGDLAGAVEAAERMIGLGPGLAPGGDNMINGLLLALRLLGGAISGGTRAVWLADWLGAAVTSDAAQRTTSLGATLLYCAARGQASAEVSAVLRGLAGQEPLGQAARKLLATGQAQGADVAWGLVAGCQAALALAHPAR